MSLLPSWCPPYSPVKTDPVTGIDVYCICKKPDEGELMVGCDGCDDWFHFKCLKVPTKYRKLVFSFFCPYCQSGITGKPTEDGELPKTLWKRKCRLETCYEPCLENSKYCSEVHGVEYIQNMVNKTKVEDKSLGIDDSPSFLIDMVDQSGDSVKKFTSMGEYSFINSEVNKEENPSLYEEIIENDAKLRDLENNLNECQHITYPNLIKQFEDIQKYNSWLDKVNDQITSTDNNESEAVQPSSTKRKRKKVNNRAKKTKGICGYISDFNTITTTPEEFVKDYKVLDDEDNNDADVTRLHSVCIKRKCNKHLDWSSMRLGQVNLQLRSLENFQERLKVLIRTRKQQLNIQFYERSLNLTPPITTKVE